MELTRTWRPVRELVAVGGRVYFLFDPPRSGGKVSDTSHVLVQSIEGGPPKLLMRRIPDASTLHVGEDDAVYVRAGDEFLRRDPGSGETAPAKELPRALQYRLHLTPILSQLCRDERRSIWVDGEPRAWRLREQLAGGPERVLFEKLVVHPGPAALVGDALYMTAHADPRALFRLALVDEQPPVADRPPLVWAEEVNLTAYLYDLGGGRMRALFGEHSKLGCTWFRREEGDARHVLACLPMHLMEKAMPVLVERGLLKIS
jgi:hypothetical protein